MDALTTLNLEDSLLYDKKLKEISEKDGNKMNRTTCGIIRSSLIQDLKYQMMTKIFTMKIWEILERKYLTKSIENRLHLKRRLYLIFLKKGISIDEHMINYTKLLTDLAEVDEVIKNEDKSLIMLSSFPDDDHETFVLTLINGNQSFSYNEVSAALVNHELRQKDNNSSNITSAEALTTRKRSSNHKGKDDRGDQRPRLV